MSKNELRNRMRERNKSIAKRERQKISHDIFDTIEKLPQFASAKLIAIYSALPDEPCTNRAIERWSTIFEKEILIPKVLDSTKIEFYNYDKSNTSIGAFGILEPKTETASPTNASEIDLIIIPGVAFSAAGDRLGRGKGYYDRYLARPNLNAYKIGVCYPHQIVEKMVCEKHDIKLDKVINAAK